MQMFFGSVKNSAFAKPPSSRFGAPRATARQAPRLSSVSLSCDTNVLGLGEKSQRFFAAFAADAAGFHAAEGDAQVAHEPAVYPDCAGVNFFGDAVRAIQILRPDTRGQAVVGVVGVADHFFFVVEGRDRDHRPEDFFAIGAT